TSTAISANSPITSAKAHPAATSSAPSTTRRAPATVPSPSSRTRKRPATTSARSRRSNWPRTFRSNAGPRRCSATASRSCAPAPYERRDELSRAAVDMARRCGDAGTLAAVLSDRHVGMWEPSNVDARLEIAAEILRVAEAAGDHERALEARGLRLMDLLELG